MNEVIAVLEESLTGTTSMGRRAAANNLRRRFYAFQIKESLVIMISWTGSAFVVAGWYFLSENRPQLGCICGILGSSLWAIEGCILGSPALVTLEVVMVVLGARAFLNLGRGNGNDNSGKARDVVVQDRAACVRHRR